MLITVIVPVHNGGNNFQKCLNALFNSERQPDEIIVVDDASTDHTAEIAGQLNVKLARNRAKPLGPAWARNHGASMAGGEILLFIDADVMMHPDVISRVEHYFSAEPEVSALFGSYDANPPERNLVSLYKNLQHHFVHQNSRREAATFWAGCGAVRRELFLQVGGFSLDFAKPSIEDIELGYRLRQRGCRIWLCKDVQVTHLKHWNFKNWLRTEIVQRAVPWSQLIMSSANLPDELNLDIKSRLSAVCAWLLVLTLPLAAFIPIYWLFVGITLFSIIGLNFQLYRFFYHQGGLFFSFGAVFLHILYYLYSSAVFGWIWLKRKLSPSHPLKTT